MIMRTSVFYCAAAFILVGIQIAVLHTLGQPFLGASGHILLWVNDPFSSDMSQQLADWYSFSHIIHWFIFFGILCLIVSQKPKNKQQQKTKKNKNTKKNTKNSPAV